MSHPPQLLLTRPDAENRRTAAMLQEAGFRVISAPCMIITPLESPPLASIPQGVIVTSQHAAAALPHYHLPVELPIFTVGAVTEKTLRDGGCQQVLCSAGDAQQLIPLILETCPPPAPLLYVRGADIRYDFAPALHRLGYTLENSVVYRAEGATEFPPVAIAALRTGALHGIVFYSARTVELFVGLAHQSGIADRHWQSLTCVTISKQIAQAARFHGFDDVHVVPLLEGNQGIEMLKTLFF